MKFSSVQKGRRAERRVTLPGFDPEPELIIRPLTGLEERDVLRLALEFGAEQGQTTLEPGDQLYDLGLMVHTLAIGCLDVDSPEEDRKPFFDGGAEQILAELPRETIHFLFQRHELWQDECSPYARALPADELMAKAAEVAASLDDRPFTSLSPATRWLFTRTLASLLLSSPEPRSASGEP